MSSPRARPWGWALAAAAVIMGVNLVALVLERTYGGPTPGPASSSYSTAPDGTAAYAEMLRRFGRDVTRLRVDPARAAPDPDATLFVLDPGELDDADVRALGAFVRAGGRLIAGGWAQASLEGLISGAPRLSQETAGIAFPVVPVDTTAGVDSVMTKGRGIWHDARSTLPVLQDRQGRVPAAIATLGDGTIVLLANATPLHNHLLGRPGNARFALALAPDGRDVAFAESIHGYRDAEGFRALPARWRWFGAFLGLAAIVWLVARGRRLVPPQQKTRDLPPPRRAYVDALATTLGRTRRIEEAIAPLKERTVAALAARRGVPDDADDRTIAAAGLQQGLTQQEVDALLRPVRNEREALTVGEAFIKVTGGRS